MVTPPAHNVKIAQQISNSWVGKHYLPSMLRLSALDELITVALDAKDTERDALRADLAAVSLRAQEWEIKWAHADADLRACAEALEIFAHAPDDGESFIVTAGDIKKARALLTRLQSQ